DPLIVVLIDTSESMSLKDDYQKSSNRSELKRLLNVLDTNIPSRLNISKGILLADDGQFLRTLLRSHKLRVYRFADTAVALHAGEITSEQELPELLETIRGLESSGSQTKPGTAVEQILSELKATPPSSIILVSDGVATGSSAEGPGSLSEAVPELKQGRVAAWTIGVGSTQAAHDARLADVRVPEVAFLDDLISFECLIGTTGFAGRQTELTVRIRDGNELILSAPIVLPPEGEVQPYPLEWQPDRTGEVEFEIRLEPLKEESDRDNNQLVRKILIRDQPLKILLAENQPRYEYRYLKNFLEREPSVDVDSVLLKGDLQHALQDTSGQTLGGRFPVRRDQLFAYDVIILGDLSPLDLGPGVVKLLRDAVENDGTTLILIAGPRANPAAWQGSELEPLFPVELETVPFAPPASWRSRGFQPSPTIAGLQTTPAFRWSEEEGDVQSFWSSLSPWYRYEAYPDLKSGAVVWLATESLGPGLPGLPLIVEQRFGAGKVLFQATDEIWRLRYLTQDMFYGRYWLQTLRYLTRSTGEDDLGELTTNRRLYERGEPVQVRLKTSLIGPESQPHIQVSGPESFTRELFPSNLHPELFTAELTGLPTGNYQVLWQIPDSNVSLSADFRIQLARQELKDRNMNRGELSRVAEQTGGRFAEVGTARRLAEQIPPGQKILLEALAPQPLWNRWELLVLIFGLLTGEWILRKRYQLV
ncbi:MAG: VWA domain-containing protein, partial [Planctomycetes bacterium]|nr:VWA domain-containing protein [Planctomycetota bacterium]